MKLEAQEEQSRQRSRQGRLSREVEDNATSRGLHRIPHPAEARGFQTAGLTSMLFSFNFH